LRRKLGEPSPIVTVKGVGYALRLDDQQLQVPRERDERVVAVAHRKGSTHPGQQRRRRIRRPEAGPLVRETHRGHRLAVGITDGVLRVSVGLEDVRDLVEDFERALAVGLLS